jgi:cullin-4
MNKVNHDKAKQDEIILCINTLSNYIEKILTDDKISDLSYEKIYNMCYKICIAKGSTLLRDHIIKVQTTILSNQHNLLFTNEIYLDQLLFLYRNYINKMLIVSKTLMYYERNYLRNESITLVDLSRYTFYTCILIKNKEKIINLILSLIEEDRNGSYVDRVTIKSVISVIYSINNNELISDIEHKILEGSCELYKKECLKLETIYDYKEYTTFTFQRLKDEEKRIEELGLISLVDKLLLNFIQEMILAYITSDKIVYYLVNNFNDMGFFNSINYISRYNMVNEHHIFIKQFSLAIEKIAFDILAKKDDLIENLLEFIENIEKIKKFLKLSDIKELELIHIRLSSCLSNPFGLISTQLSLYIDKNYTKCDVDKIINLFKYLDDKDVFEINHRKLLSIRLLNSYCEEFEVKLISKIRLNCGSLFTHKLEIMISDIKNSHNIYNNYLNSSFYQKSSYDLSIFVLTESNWLIHNQCILNSDELLNILERYKIKSNISLFNDFHKCKYKDKVLRFNLILGKCEVTIKYKSGEYLLIMNMLQTMILFTILNNKSISFSELASLFKTTNTTLSSNINPLLVLKLLKNESHRLVLNSSFSFNRRVIKFDQKKIQSNEEKVKENIKSNRDYILDSNIIRIMKSKKSIYHNELISELLNEIKSSFNPEIMSIKLRIESLVERGYIKRDEKNNSIYVYIN